MAMPHRALGRSGLSVSAQGLGCMGMSFAYGAPDADESVATIARALELGVTFFDTADAYGSGANETLLGKALGARRKEAVVATKFALVRGEGGSFLGVSGKPDYVKKACDASLARLGIDAIDLYYQHRVDPQVPIEETVGAMAELVKAGKVRRLGLGAVGSAVGEAHAHAAEALGGHGRTGAPEGARGEGHGMSFRVGSWARGCSGPRRRRS